MSEQHDPKGKKFSELVSAYLHGQLYPEEAARLETLLRDSPQHRDRFVREAYIYHQAGELMRGDARADLMESVSADDSGESQEDLDAIVRESVIEQALSERRKHDLEDEANRLLAAQQAEDARNRRFELRLQAEPEPVQRAIVIPKVIVWLGLAAVVGIVASLTVYYGHPAADNTQTPPGTTAQTPNRSTPIHSPFVAHVRSSIDARWIGGNQNNPTLLRSDTAVTLDEGLAEVVFEDGTTVIVQGPATFEPTGANAMRLAAGRITASAPDGAQGFTVDTPSGLITDYGTEFGVITNGDGQVLAQAFNGRIGLTPHGGGEEVQIFAGESLVANTAGRIREVPPDDLAFVREEEFEAIQQAGVSPRHRWVATRYQMLRDANIIAFAPFIRPGTDWPGGIGYTAIRLLDESTEASHDLQPASFGSPVAWQGEDGIGEALVANGEDPVFIDLDTAPGGVFDSAGLLDGNGLVGRPGTTIYIMWRMQGDGTELEPDAFAGLSLMRGDRRASDEPLFVGLAALVSDWSIHPRHANALPGPDDSTSVLALVGAGQPMPADSLAHLWLVRIDFLNGPDRVQVYLDPDLSSEQLPAANATLNSYDISFDRLRFVTGNGAVAWRIDEVVISSTRPVNILGTLPVD